MDAYITHIREEFYLSKNKLSVKNRYTAWCTEMQAYKEAIRYIQKDWMWYNCNHVLRQTVTLLIDLEKFKEAIELVNEFSVATPPEHVHESTGAIMGSIDKKSIITIEKSTFLGSPFE